jgi:hypothetical protein
VTLILLVPSHGGARLVASAFLVAEHPSISSTATTKSTVKVRNAKESSSSLVHFSSWYPQDNNNDNDTNDENEEDDTDRSPAVSGGNYLEALAVAVALFFVGTVAAVGGDALFATPLSPTSPGVIIDADATLRDDFERSSSSVLF